MASLRPATFVAFLIDRLASEAARSSSATASTGGGAKSGYIPPLLTWWVAPEAPALKRRACASPALLPLPFPFS